MVRLSFHSFDRLTDKIICSRDTFNDIMGLIETLESHEYVQSRPPQTAAARQLYKSRQHLGLQRHDLMVAMRVVNAIEREILQAEWENWLLEENAKCKHLGALIHQNSTHLVRRQASNKQKALGVDSSRLQKVQAWHQEYCEDCSRELGLAGVRLGSRN